MALLAAILCVSSYINIPLPFSPVPITAQVLVIFMIGLLLRPRPAFMTVLVWALLGMAGLPVFSGGRGGVAVFAGPTGGYLVGYFLGAVATSYLCKKCRRNGRKLLVLLCAGIPLIYVAGIPWMKFVTGMEWPAACVTGIAPYLPWDIIKAVAAVFIAKPLYAITGTALKAEE